MGWHNEIASQRSFGPTPGSRGKGRARGRQGREVAGKGEERRRPRDREDRRVDQRLDQDRRVRRGRVGHPPTRAAGPPPPRAASARGNPTRTTPPPPPPPRRPGRPTGCQ